MNVTWTETLIPSDAQIEFPVPDGVRLWQGIRSGTGWTWRPEGGTDPDESWLASICCEGRVSPRAVAMAARFVAHLISYREARNLIPGTVRAYTYSPQKRPGFVAIPHLMTIIDANGRTSDHVVWETLAESRFASWLGASKLPDLAWIEDRLADLLAFRARARCGLLGSTDDERALVAIIDSRFLSIRAVCQNEALFRRLLGASRVEPETRLRKTHPQNR